MTEKRFYEINSQILGLKTIQDKNKRYTFPPLKTEKNHMFLKALNELVADCNILKKENEQLKQQVRNISDQRNEFHRGARENANRIGKLEKENEQLKQYIYDNLDEDICDVCSYQYLEKSQMEKYYVAKCKKGYDNCSKGTVIHCKDFKFKELQE